MMIELNVPYPNLMIVFSQVSDRVVFRSLIVSPRVSCWACAAPYSDIKLGSRALWVVVVVSPK